MFHLVLITQPSEHTTQPETQRVRRYKPLKDADPQLWECHHHEWGTFTLRWCDYRPCCLEKCQQGCVFVGFLWTSRSPNHAAFVLHQTGQFLGTELMRKQHKAVKEGRCWASRSSYGPAGSAATTAVNQPVVCCGWNCCRLESHGKVRALTLAIRGNETRTPGQRGESGEHRLALWMQLADWFLLGSQVITSNGAATGREINIYDINLSLRRLCNWCTHSPARTDLRPGYCHASPHRQEGVVTSEDGWRPLAMGGMRVCDWMCCWNLNMS